MSHDTIIEHIHGADFGFIHYPDNVATSQRIPTKLFEYMAAGLPIITPDNSIVEVAKSYQAPLISYQILEPDYDAVATSMTDLTIDQYKPSRDLFWSSYTSIIERLFQS